MGQIHSWTLFMEYAICIHKYDNHKDIFFHAQLCACLFENQVFISLIHNQH